MKVLVLGGTLFLGRHIAEAALAAGHEVALFNRGITDPDLFGGRAEQIAGDRDGGLAPLDGRRWDAVIDTSGYVPRIVGQSVRLLAERSGMYCYISSISAYASFEEEEQDESAETAKLEDPLSEDVQAHYGALKALCEQEAVNGFGERAMIVRPGLIVGPYDPTDRFTYWPLRFAAGGDVLIPGKPERPIQWIDARDLAEWIVRMLERKAGGIYNAVTPAYAFTMGDLAAEGLKLANAAKASPVWADERFLEANDVGEWMELPLWIKEKSRMPGFLTCSGRKAAENGLTFRPLALTLKDTLAWAEARPESRKPKAGMDRKREADLLAEWRTAQSRST